MARLTASVACSFHGGGEASVWTPARCSGRRELREKERRGLGHSQKGLWRKKEERGEPEAARAAAALLGATFAGERRRRLGGIAAVLGGVLER